MIKYEEQKLEKQIDDSSNLFLVIAVFSIINTAISIADLNLNFMLGLGITQLIDAYGDLYARGTGSSMPLVLSFLADGLVVSIFLLLGYFSKKRKNWAFIVGMILYAADTLVFIRYIGAINFVFHAFALGITFKGFDANRMLVKMQDTEFREDENILVSTAEKSNYGNPFEVKECTIKAPGYYKVTGWFCFLFSLVMGISSIYYKNIFVLPIFIFFSLMGLAIILLTGKMVMNHHGMKMVIPMGTYFISWNEIEYAEKSNGTILVGGNDKKFSFATPEAWPMDVKQIAMEMLSEKLQERNISIKRSFRANFPSFKNSKVIE